MQISPQQLETLPVFYEGQHTRIYYQEQSEYDGPVLIKILKTEYPTPQQVVQFSNEYTLTHELEVQGVRKACAYGVIGKRHALLLRYFPGDTLKEAMKTADWTLPDKLRIAISAARALRDVHQHNIIHKDINGRNILVNPENLHCMLIDFGIASQVDLKTHHLGNPETLEGTLQYISPEQTGRMNRIVDYRTDLYSFGVTLYELFTGQLPFETQDVMELVHCHIAKMPVPPRDVPPILSDLIMKLLNKNAEDRYQSAHGVAVDLEKCLALAESDPAALQDRSVLPFRLAQDDASGRFQVAQKLYGRETEIDLLLKTFWRVSRKNHRQAELLLVSGYSGVGNISATFPITLCNRRLKNSRPTY